MFFGCAIRITDWLSADIYYRTMDITLDGRHYGQLFDFIIQAKEPAKKETAQ